MMLEASWLNDNETSRNKRGLAAPSSVGGAARAKFQAALDPCHDPCAVSRLLLLYTL